MKIDLHTGDLLRRNINNSLWLFVKREGSNGHSTLQSVKTGKRHRFSDHSLTYHFEVVK